MKKILKVFLFILLAWILFTATDFTLSKLNKRPIFAIPIKIYKDGGTCEYYGLGYKVIKYNTLDDRTDAVFGSWSLQYDDY